MDSLTFISEIVKSLAWPATVIALVLLLRRHVFDALMELKRLKWNDMELEFEKKALETKARAIKVVPREMVASPVPEIEELESRLLDLIAISPKAAVLESWAEIEKEVADLLRRRSIPLDQIGRPTALLSADLLRRIGVLDEEEIRLLSSLRQLRNSAAHDHGLEITEDSALNYISAATNLIRSLVRK